MCVYSSPAQRFGAPGVVGVVDCSLVTQSCPTLCDPVDRSTPGLAVLHYLLEFSQTHIHWVGDAISPSHSLLSPSPPALKSFPASGSFPMSQLFESVAPSIRASASTSVFPMNIQGWFPSGLTELISLLSTGLSIKSLLQHHDLKASILRCSGGVMGPQICSLPNLKNLLKCYVTWQRWIQVADEIKVAGHLILK